MDMLMSKNNEESKLLILPDSSDKSWDDNETCETIFISSMPKQMETTNDNANTKTSEYNNI